MWVDTGVRLVNIRDADTIDIVREIGDVRGGERDAWTYSVIAVFGERREILASVTTFPPRDAQVLDDFGGSASRIHAVKSRHAAAATAECARRMRVIAMALSADAPYCLLDDTDDVTLDPDVIELEMSPLD